MSDSADISSSQNLQSWAIALLSVALFIMAAFQTYMQMEGRANLSAARENQEQAFQAGEQVREQTEAIAGRVALLAQAGNANAQAVVANMQQQGVGLTPPGSSVP